MNDEYLRSLMRRLVISFDNDLMNNPVMNVPASPTILSLKGLERALQLLDERPKPPFTRIFVVRPDVKSFVTEMDGKQTLIISRAEWSQFAGGIYTPPASGNNFMGNFSGIEVIFERESEPEEAETQDKEG